MKLTPNSSAATPKSSTSQYYRPELDAVRFLAFFLVFLHHTLPSGTDPRVVHLLKGFAPAFDSLTDACGFGLSLFFTLSAFLICELLLRERDSVGTIGIKQFYIRRILRIWPLYYFGLASAVMVALLPGGHSGDITQVGWFAVFMAPLYVASHAPGTLPVTPLWSISTEEQFYLFAPWVVKYASRKMLYCFCGLLLLISNSWIYFLGRVSAIDRRIWFSSSVQFECFAGGIFLCLFLRRRMPSIVAWQRLLILAFAFSCWFYACYGFHARFGSAVQQNPGSWPLILGYALATLSSVLILVAFMGVNPKLVPGWAVYLGRISFGLYVFHDFAIYATDHLVMQRFMDLKDNPMVRKLEGPIYLLNIGLTLGLTILMAALSYRYLETPFLKMKKRREVIKTEPVLS